MSKGIFHLFKAATKFGSALNKSTGSGRTTKQSTGSYRITHNVTYENHDDTEKTKQKRLLEEMKKPYDVNGMRFKSYDEALMFAIISDGGIISNPNGSKQKVTVENGEARLEVL